MRENRPGVPVMSTDETDTMPQRRDAGPGVPEPAEHKPERLSQMLRRLLHTGQDTFALGQITRMLKDRGFGALMLLLAAPNLVPLPPGVSTIFGIPLILVATQLIIGYRKPLLPRAVRNRELSARTLTRVIDWIVPWVERFERLASPRLWFLPQRLSEQLIGGIALLMGLIMALPIPFGNFLPAVAVILLSLGLGERDGAWTGAGIAVAIASVGIVIGVVGVGGFAILKAF